MKKQTSLLVVHFLTADMKHADEWFIENKDGTFSVRFSDLHRHAEWLSAFDYNVRQYSFYSIAMTRDECEKVAEMLAAMRAAEPQQPAAAQQEEEQLKPHHRLIIELKDRGMSNRQIAILLNLTEDAVKKFFFRKAQDYDVKGYHAVIRVIRKKYTF